MFLHLVSSLCLCLALCVLLAPLTLSQSSTTTYTTSIAVRGGAPVALVVDSSDNVYAILNQLGAGSTVVKFNASRALVGVVLNFSTEAAGAEVYGFSARALTLAADNLSVIVTFTQFVTDVSFIAAFFRVIDGNGGAVRQINTTSRADYVAAAANGEYYLSTETAVVVVNSSGTVTAVVNTTLVPAAFSNGAQLLSDAAFNLYILSGAVLTKLLPNGTVLASYNVSSTDLIAAAICASGEVYLLDDDDNVARFSSDGTLLSSFTDTTATYWDPTSIACTPAGSVLVGDSYNARIVEFDAAGVQLGSFSTAGNTLFEDHGMVEVNGTFFVVGGQTDGDALYLNAIYSNGSHTVLLDTSEINVDIPHFPYGLAVDHRGRLYLTVEVGPYDNTTAVLQFNPSGTLLQTFTTPTLALTTAVAVSRLTDYVFAGSTVASEVVVFAQNGTVVMNFTQQSGFGNYQFYPTSVAITDNDTLAVLDFANNVVVVFNASDGVQMAVVALPAADYFDALSVATYQYYIFVMTGSGAIGVYTLFGTLVNSFTVGSAYTPTEIFIDQGTGVIYTVDEDAGVIFQSVPNAVSTVTGDPQFVGLRGQRFQVHGIDGAVYALVSSLSTQVNSRFVFLEHGVCPNTNSARPASNCWSHPGSYLQSIAVTQRLQDGRLMRLEVQAGPAAAGFSSVLLDGKPLKLGAASGDASSLFHVSWLDSHSLTFTTAQFVFAVENSDGFVNLASVQGRAPLASIVAHGLLGQTTRDIVHNSKLRVIEGEVDDYAILGNDLFGADFVYRQFDGMEQ